MFILAENNSAADENIYLYGLGGDRARERVAAVRRAVRARRYHLGRNQININVGT